MKNSKSRLENVTLNSLWAIISQGLITLLGLFSRKIFLDYLGAELLGVNSLFSDVLMLFSFADLGFGTAIMFSMYSPVAQKDDEKVSSLLLFYKKIYNYVIALLVLISICFVPFLGSIKTEIPLQDLCFYYAFFQISNIVEYVWAYRESYVMVCQEERKLTIINLLYTIVKYMLQIISVIVYHNFVVYLAIGLLCVLVKKILLNTYILREYPITSLKGAKKLLRQDEKNILKKSFALLVTKIGNLIINQTDSLIVSYMINVTQWGFASNYLLIRKSIFSITDKIYTAVLPSMGNLVASNNKERELNIFLKYDFINAWIHTFCFVGLVCLSNAFILIFFGDQVLLSNIFVFIFYLAAFIDGLRAPVSVMREASGTYEADKWYTIIASVVNIVISIPMALICGITGVYIGTICSMATLHVCRSYVLFKNGKYAYTFLRYIGLILNHITMGLMICLCTFIIANKAGSLISNKYAVFVLKSLIVVLIPNALWIAIYHKTPEYTEVINIIKGRVIKVAKLRH